MVVEYDFVWKGDYIYPYWHQRQFVERNPNPVAAFATAGS